MKIGLELAKLWQLKATHAEVNRAGGDGVVRHADAGVEDGPAVRAVGTGAHGAHGPRADLVPLDELVSREIRPK